MEIGCTPTRNVSQIISNSNGQVGGPGPGPVVLSALCRACRRMKSFQPPFSKAGIVLQIPPSSVLFAFFIVSRENAAGRGEEEREKDRGRHEREWLEWMKRVFSLDFQLRESSFRNLSVSPFTIRLFSSSLSSSTKGEHRRMKTGLYLNFFMFQLSTDKKNSYLFLAEGHYLGGSS